MTLQFGRRTLLLLVSLPKLCLAWAFISIIGAGPSLSDPSKSNVCIDAETGCTEPTGDQKPLSEWKLGQLGCEPLAVIRNRIWFNSGMCVPGDYVGQFFNQDCVPDPAKQQKVFDDAVKATWTADTFIKRLERLKGCVHR